MVAQPRARLYHPFICKNSLGYDSLSVLRHFSSLYATLGLGRLAIPERAIFSSYSLIYSLHSRARRLWHPFTVCFSFIFIVSFVSLSFSFVSFVSLSFSFVSFVSLSFSFVSFVSLSSSFDFFISSPLTTLVHW